MVKFIRAKPDFKRDFRATLGLDDATPLLCAVGTLTENKGHLNLVKALAVSNTAAHLVIAGDGPMRATIEAAIDELGLKSRVHLMGRVSPGWTVMTASDALCHASLREGLPVVLMEAQALGLPIIATAFAGAAEARDVGDGRIEIVPVGDTDALADAISRVSRLGEANHALLQLSTTYWSVSRYAAEFASAVTALTHP
ncbi:glycosyltransferase [Phycicoccus sp. Soil748]|uniref:glycosyltransferase n=1 Tax=Phycicoccus sp. Soil748 TaxID=1736397 RepID=UPI00138F8688|nr:glycosyltransferase [Phycicoccus sp. Soil748]